MFRSLRVDPSDAAPIWRQIEGGVRRLIAAETIAAGQPVPSVRDLARRLRVNPATVAKAYHRLTEEGVLTVRRGEGTFVSASPPELPAEERSRILDDAAGTYVSVARTVGAARQEVTGRVTAAWERLFGDGRDGDEA